jgi:hypothetical protein
MAARVEEYRSSVTEEVENMRARIRELEAWKRMGLRKQILEAEKRQDQIDRIKVPPRSEERGPPSMPVPFNDLYDKSAYKPGHFIFTDTADRYQELKIKSLCVRARLALLTYDLKKAEDLADAACKLALEFDFDPIFAKAQFWRGAAAYQMGLWTTAIEAFAIGQRAKGIYIEGAVSETFLGKAKTELAQRQEEARRAEIAKTITEVEEGAVHRDAGNPATATEESLLATTDSPQPPYSLAAELDEFSFNSGEASRSAKPGDIDN